MGETVGGLKVGEWFRKWDGGLYRLVEKTGSRAKIKPQRGEAYEVAHGTEVLEVLGHDKEAMMEKEDRTVNSNDSDKEKEKTEMENEKSTKKTSAKAPKAAKAKREAKKVVAAPKNSKRAGNVAKVKATAKPSAGGRVYYTKAPSEGTIGGLVYALLTDKKTEPTFEAIGKVVKRKFPDSKFNSGHLSWYKRAFTRNLKVKINKSSDE